MMTRSILIRSRGHGKRPCVLAGWQTHVLACLLPAVMCACGGGGGGGSAPAGMSVRQSNLVSDVAGQAAVTDPDLVNAWGVAASPTGPFWIADNGDGVSTLYDGSGQPVPAGQPLVVEVPPPADSPAGTASAPTGVVFNGTSDFVVAAGADAGPSAFIFATEDGTLSGWSPAVNAGAAVLTVDNSAQGAIYKGLALGANGRGNLLFATDFHAAHVDVFDGAFRPTHLAGAFADSGIPSGFAPFGIAVIGDSVYVTYAQQDDNHEDDVPGPGNGYVNIFDTNGNLVRRFVSQGVLNAPWGIVLAPAGFGRFANMILIGNFGDGEISAFDPATGKLMGQLTDGKNPIHVDGLWGLMFGNGAGAGDANTLFFTAGPDDESHGLFGMLRASAGDSQGGSTYASGM